MKWIVAEIYENVEHGRDELDNPIFNFEKVDNVNCRENVLSQNDINILSSSILRDSKNSVSYFEFKKMKKLVIKHYNKNSFIKFVKLNDLIYKVINEKALNNTKVLYIQQYE